METQTRLSRHNIIYPRSAQLVARSDISKLSS